MNLDYIAGFFDGEGSCTISVAPVRHNSKYGFDSNPSITIAQKDPAVLHEIRGFLEMGNVYFSSTGRGICTIHIRAKDDMTKFVQLMKGRVRVKAKQIELLGEALKLRKTRGGTPLEGPYSRKDFLKILDIAEDLWHLNGCKGHLGETISRARQLVESFDEEAFSKHFSQYLFEFAKAKRRDFPKKELEKLHWEDKLSYAQIATLLSCSRNTIKRRFREYGIPARKSGWRPWNRGLTKETDQRVARYAMARMKVSA